MHHHGQINRKEVTVLTPFIHTYTVDVRGGMRCERARYPVGQGDALADRFVVTIMDGGTPVKLTGVGVVATVIRPDGLSVALKGTVQDGAACVTLDDKCYDVAGNITVTVILEAGEMRQSVLQVALNVTTGETDVIAETPVLNVADVLAAAERAEAAAKRAEAAGGGGSGGSGGGAPSDMSAHIISLTPNDDGSFTPDITFEEALSIYNSGRALLCEFPEMGMAISANIYIPGYGLIFAATDSGISLSILFSSSDIVEVFAQPIMSGALRIYDNQSNLLFEFNGTEETNVWVKDIAYVKSVNGVSPDWKGNITVPVATVADVLAALPTWNGGAY